MSVGSKQFAVTSTPAVIASVPTVSYGGPVGQVWVLPDASAEVYIGGVNVSSSNGLKITHGTTLPIGPFDLFSGDALYAVTASTATLGVLQT